MADEGKISTTAEPKFTFETVAPTYYPTWGFRPNTPMYPLKMNFIFLNGGMGDYITWIQPIRWLANQATWIKGTLVCPTYLKDLAHYFLKDFPEWGLKDYKEIDQLPKIDDTPFRGPVVLQQESLNATGAHLATCGWVYFTNKECAPKGNSEKVPEGWASYPQFRQSDLDAMDLPDEAKGLEPGKYVVLTTGVTTESRRIPGTYWNYVLDHLINKGLKPVFLGKTMVTTGNAKNIHTEWSREFEWNRGLDLRDKTSLLQAASIMSRAALVVGHDNGLLHLAGCTSVPIVFGYNLASPQHRQPLRPAGQVYNVHLEPGELACNFCQSETNFVIGYNFRTCFYGDNKCIDLLFKDGAQRWRQKIDEALEASGRS